MRGLHRVFSLRKFSLYLPIRSSSHLSTHTLILTRHSLNIKILSCNRVRLLSEAVNPLPLPTNEIPDKIRNIVEEIGQLNLLEISQLNSHLKETLGLSDIPMMPTGGAIAPVQEDEEEKKVEQTEFTVKLIGFEVDKKIKLIKEIKSLLPDLNLVQAKKFVETPPGVIRKDIPKEEAEKLMDLLKSLGGKIELE